MDYTFTTVSSYNGRGGTERAIKVFDTTTGETVCFCRRLPFENKAAWINRAMLRALGV